MSLWYNRIMDKNKGCAGFTIVELSLSLVFTFLNILFLPSLFLIITLNIEINYTIMYNNSEVYV